MSDAEKTLRKVESTLEHPHMTNGEKNEEAQRLIRRYFRTLGHDEVAVRNVVAEPEVRGT